LRHHHLSGVNTARYFPEADERESDLKIKSALRAGFSGRVNKRLSPLFSWQNAFDQIDEAFLERQIPIL
jgi:hypothetical protein